MLDEGGDLLARQNVFRCGAGNGEREFARHAQAEVGLAYVEGAGLAQRLAGDSEQGIGVGFVGAAITCEADERLVLLSSRQQR